jgi:hypothetical protein
MIFMGNSMIVSTNKPVLCEGATEQAVYNVKRKTYNCDVAKTTIYLNVPSPNKLIKPYF